MIVETTHAAGAIDPGPSAREPVEPAASIARPTPARACCAPEPVHGSERRSPPRAAWPCGAGGPEERKRHEQAADRDRHAVRAGDGHGKHGGRRAAPRRVYCPNSSPPAIPTAGRRGANLDRGMQPGRGGWPRSGRPWTASRSVEIEVRGRPDANVRHESRRCLASHASAPSEP